MYEVPVKSAWFFVSSLVIAVILIAGCSIFRSTTYNLLTELDSSGTQVFDFVIGVDLIKDLGGDEDKVVSDLLLTELKKHRICLRGYKIISRHVHHGADYLRYRGHCNPWFARDQHSRTPAQQA